MRINWNTARLRVDTRCGRVRCEAGWRLDRRWSESLTDFDLWVVWAGHGRMQLRDRSIELYPGVCLWARPGGLYLGEQDIANRLGVNFIHFDLLDARGRRIADRLLPPEVAEVEDLHLFDAVTQRVVNLMQPPHPSPAIAGALLRGLLMDLEATAHGPAMQLAPGPTRRHRRQVMEIVARIRESPAEVSPVGELARQCGYSVDHFTRLFKQVTGLAPEALIIQARVARAKQLLRETDLAIGAVAEALGYCDPYFFSRQFKQQAGLTPLQFRRRQGADFRI